MIDVLKFIFEYTLKFISMLFTIDVGDGINLGTMMCVVFIFLPTVLFVVNFLKSSFLDELDDRYDHSGKRYKKDEGRSFYFKSDEPVFSVKNKNYILKKKSDFPKKYY